MAKISQTSRRRLLRFGSGDVEEDVGGHAGAQVRRVGGEADLDAEDLFDAVFLGLNVARREFSAASNLFDLAFKIFAGKGIDLDSHLIAKVKLAEPGGGNINAQPEMAGVEQGNDRRVRRENVARFYVERFDDSGRGGSDFQFFDLRLDFGELSLSGSNTFGTRTRE